MCESSVFLRRESGDELVMEDVARVVPEGDEVRVLSLLGDEARVRGEIAEIDLMAHRIVIRERSGAASGA
jgi:predicted RNA-binding protein